MNFIEKLDLLILENNLNKNSLSQKSDIPYTTIDGWYKKGYSNVKLPSVQKLADFFNVSLDYLANDLITDKDYGKTYGFSISYDEVNLVKKYRSLNESGKEMVNMVLDKELERAEDQNKKTPLRLVGRDEESTTDKKQFSEVILSDLQKSARNETAKEAKGKIDRPFKELLAEDLKNAISSDDDLR